MGMENIPELHGKALGNQYALHALRERRAELAGEITQLESRVRHLRESLTHVDGTLALFDPNGDPSTIPAKKPYGGSSCSDTASSTPSSWTPSGAAHRPMTTREVRAAIIAEVGFGPDTAKGMDSRLRTNLLYLEGAGTRG